MSDIKKCMLQKIENIITTTDGDMIEMRDYEIIDHNCGITHIKYRKKMKQLVHLASAITTVGLSLPFTLTINYMVRSKWYNCYFETSSGKFLGDSQNNAAEAINKIGLEAIRKGNFAEAKELFNEALVTCEETYNKRETFANLSYAMDFALDGLNYLKDGHFKEACEKFQEAYNRSVQVPEMCDKFNKYINVAKLATEALDLAIRKIYREAMENFEDAYDQSDIDEIKAYFSDCKEVINTIINSQKLLTLHRIEDAEEHLSAALTRTRGIINRIISNELDSVRKKGKEEEAAKLYKKGMILWNEAWNAENNQEANNARHIFQNAKRKFEEAYNLIQNSEINKWILIVDYKIKGNELFNKGTAQQEMDNNSNEGDLYQEAYNMYEKSKNSFQEGYNLSDDQRFLPAIEFVDECKNEIKRIIQSMPDNAQVVNRTIGNDESNNTVHDSMEYKYILEQND